jgi:hypothetical protein
MSPVDHPPNWSPSQSTAAMPGLPAELDAPLLAMLHKQPALIAVALRPPCGRSQTRSRARHTYRSSGGAAACLRVGP